MTAGADICLIVEGGYPYVLGGVASWSDALMRASPQLTFHVIAIGISSQPRRRKLCASRQRGRGHRYSPRRVSPWPDLRRFATPMLLKRVLQLLEDALTIGDASTFEELIRQVRVTGFGQAALLDSREGWHAMERAYERLLPNAPLLDFFWSWRFLARSVLAIISTPLPQAGVFHAVATGFAGLVGSYAKLAARLPLLVTEHGIYTNERRIELAVADWLYDLGAGRLHVTAETEGAALDLVDRLSVLLGHELWGCRRHNHAVPGQSGLSAVRRRAGREASDRSQWH